MTKTQALAMMAALEGATVPASANLTFPTGGGELWTVTIPDTATLSGVQIGELATYCAANGLTLSATFSALGVT
jgi:hypothetical protein